MSLELLSNFHFMRPLWLIGLLALPLVWLSLRRFNYPSGDWGKSIDPALLAHLTPDNTNSSENKKNWPPIAIIFLTIIALAGPSWERKPTPVAQLQDDLIVILDLSISMLASDIAPSRLVRAKQKLQDLLALRSEGNTSLIVFSGDSHAVTPLTDDINTIKSSLEAVDPFIMPVIGSRPDLAVKESVKLFEQNGSRSGRIILIADGITKPQISRINETLSSHRISLSVIAVGTKEGAPINIPGKGYFKSQGEVVIPQTPLDLLNQLATQNQGLMHELSLDDSDLHYLDVSGKKLRETKAKSEHENSAKTFDTWIDAGYLILFILLPVILIAHRQNTLLLTFLTTALITTSEPSYAFDLSDLFKTNDQKAQELMNNDSYEEAAQTFDSAEHKAAAHYRAGNFDQANKIYSELNSERALYNQANSLAKNQKLDEALQTYKKVLELNPDHEDALFNKQLIEKLLEENTQNQENQESDQSDTDNSDEPKQQNPENQDSDQQNQGTPGDGQKEKQGQDSQPDNTDSMQSDSQDSDTEDKQSNEQKKEQSTSQTNNNEDSENESSENSISSALQELNEEEKQSYEQWMRRVPDDPSGLLRRKFEQQSYERRRSGGTDTLNEGEPVW